MSSPEGVIGRRRTHRPPAAAARQRARPPAGYRPAHAAAEVAGRGRGQEQGLAALPSAALHEDRRAGECGGGAQRLGAVHAGPPPADRRAGGSDPGRRTDGRRAGRSRAASPSSVGAPPAPRAGDILSAASRESIEEAKSKIQPIILDRMDMAAAAQLSREDLSHQLAELVGRNPRGDEAPAELEGAAGARRAAAQRHAGAWARSSPCSPTRRSPTSWSTAPARSMSSARASWS